jgi:GGDEF domain-containing protein
MDDAVYRFGGDEFVLLLPNVANVENCTAVVNRVLEGIAEPVRLGNGEYVRVTASVGVALFPGDGHALEELMHLADQAMYLAKRRELHSSPVSYVGAGSPATVGSKLPPTLESASVGASLLATVGSKLPPTATAA